MDDRKYMCFVTQPVIFYLKLQNVDSKRLLKNEANHIILVLLITMNIKGIIYVKHVY